MSASDPLVGTLLSERYRVIRRVGEGGMGIVYEAQHVLIEKRVALKILKDDFSSRPDVVARFRQEAKSASRIGHEHIVDISDFGETPGGQSYFVMEFLEGQDLASVLGREGTLEPARAIEIALQCCRALGAAHAKGIVHRDMKPENVFLVRRDDRRDFVKIVDFGIAKMSELDGPGEGKKLTKTGMIFGTPEYMSPEQASGKPLDHRVDVYAMGVILFEMLTGRVPFVGDTFMGILTQHLFEPPPSLVQVNATVQCPEALERIVYRCLAKDANERYASMEALAGALEDAATVAGGYSKSVGTLAGYARTRTPISKPPETVPGGTPLPHGAGGGRRLSGALLVVGGIGAFVGVVGLGWALTMLAPRGPATTAGPLPVPAVRPPTPAEPGGDPAADAPAGSELPTPRVLRVSLITEPQGARATVPNRGVVCQSTPCTIESMEGEPLVVEVRKGRLAGRGEITPIESNTSLSVRLEPVRSNGARAEPSDAPPPRDPNAPSLDDLKNPDVFR